jgi:mannosyltransferase OCH1-like enzyme
MSCEEQLLIKRWQELNPEYTHRLWSDTDIQAFMEQHYPELVPLPFNAFLTGVERADIFRVLVLHKVG